MKPNRAARRAKQRAWEAAQPRVRILSTLDAENDRAEAAGMGRPFFRVTRIGYDEFVTMFDRGDGQGMTLKPLEHGEWPKAMLTQREMTETEARDLAIYGMVVTGPNGERIAPTAIYRD